MPGNFRQKIKLVAGGHAALQRAIARDPGELLNERHFLFILGVAFVLHLVAMGVWHMMPREQVIDIPVRALNIKLGDAEVMITAEAPQPQAANKQDVENTISRLVRDPGPQKQARAQSVTKSVDKAVSMPKKTPPKSPSKAVPSTRKFDMRSEGIKAAAPVTPVIARQFVRDLPAPAIAKPAPAKSGTRLGNSSAAEAEMISRYEQLISLWIQKFKLYPDEARLQEMQGETVVRIRIDRRGNILYYALERSTGHDVLDRAAINMIRRANPVPAVPVDYPPAQLLEFLIPVNFQLQ